MKMLNFGGVYFGWDPSLQCACRWQVYELRESSLVTCCSLDLKSLGSDLVEIILRVVPTDQEIKLYREYEADGKPVEVLADEDKFMLAVSFTVCHCWLEFVLRRRISVLASLRSISGS